MPSVRFDYEGQTYNANVTDEFLSLPAEEQKKRLEVSLKPEKAPAKGGGFMGLLAKIERPAQALKVGLKETELGGDIHQALGGIDTTPNEGFGTGFKRGLLGEEEIRTQDFLDPSLPGWYRGIVGFAGDVATDPVTYAGGLIGKTIYGVAKGARSATPPQVARWMQTIKDHDKVKDFARALNMPLGREREVKAVAQTAAVQGEKVYKKMVKALPKMEIWMKQKIKSSGKSEEEVYSAFRNWLDRPALDNPKNKPYPIYTNFHKPDEDKLRKATVAILGEDGLKYADEWEKTLTGFLKEEQAAGIFVRGLIMRHYFPRFDTPAGRELIESGKAADDFIPDGLMPKGDDPLLYFGRHTFRSGREADQLESLDDINMRKAERIGGTAYANPADIPYEKRFFHTDPNVAIGLRYADHASAMQTKFFIDHVTDFGLRPRSSFVVRNAEKGLPPVLGVGRWMRRSPDDPAVIQQRTLGEAGEEIWQPIDADMSDWVSVKGIPDKYRNHKELIEEADRIEAATYGQAVAGVGDFDKAVLPKDALPLSRKAREDFIAKEGLIESTFKAPKDIAKQMEHQMELMGASKPGNKELQKFLKFYDRIQNPWKAWTLAVRPAYHMRNAIGNIFNAYIVTGLGSNIPKAVETFGDAAKLQYYARFEGRNAIKEGIQDRLLAGKPIRGTALKGLPKIDDSEWVADNFADTGFSMSKISNEALDRGINSGHYRKDVVRDEIENMEYLLGRGKYQKWSKRFGQDNPAIKAGFAMGGTIEGNARYAIFINTLNKIKKGDDLEWIAPDGKKIKLSEFGKGDNVYWTTDIEGYGGNQFAQVRRMMTKEDAIFDIAGNKVKEALFDYSDLSKFERNWMKRVMPFYTWSRKNFPVQIKHLILNPQRAEKLHLAKEQFEYDSDEIDLADIGAFWGKRVPVFLGKENAGVIKAFTMLNTIPLVEMQRLVNPKALITEMVSPFPKEIFEQLANYDSFREKPIAELSYLGLGESKDFLGVALSPRLWKLAQLLVPVTEINRLNPGGVFGEKRIDPLTREQTVTKGWGGWGAFREANPTDLSEAAKWLRFLTGTRAYDIDLEKQAYFKSKNFSRDMAELKGKLKWAIAKGENRRSEQLIRAIEAYERQSYAEE